MNNWIYMYMCVSWLFVDIRGYNHIYYKLYSLDCFVCIWFRRLFGIDIFTFVGISLSGLLCLLWEWT